MCVPLRLILCVLLLMTLATWHAHADQVDDHVAALRARAAKLQNITIRYDMTEVCTPPESLRENIKQMNARRDDGGLIVLRDGTYVTREEIRRNGPNMRFLSINLKEPAPPVPMTPIVRKESSNVDGNLAIVNIYADGKESHVIAQHQMPDSVVDVALGIRDQRHNDVLNHAAIIKPENVSVDKDNKVELAVVDDKGVRHIWTFDPANGYAVERYRIVTPNTELPNIDMRMTGHQTFDGMTLPTSIVEELLSRDKGVRVVTRTRSVSNVDYKLNDPDNTAEKLKLAEPRPQ